MNATFRQRRGVIMEVFCALGVLFFVSTARATTGDGATGAANAKTSVKATPPEVEPSLDITDRRSRERQGSAYTLHQGRVATHFSLFGTGSQELVGALGVDYGLPHKVQIGMNVLHSAGGLLNLRAKWMFYEKGPWAIAAGFSPIWIHGNWVWAASGSQAIGGLDILILPITVTGTYRPHELWQIDLMAHFVDAEILGELNSDSLAFDADLALRQISLTPRVSLHIQKLSTVYFSARLPVWATLPGTLEIEMELLSGVRVGGKTGGRLHPKFKDLYLLTLGTRTIISDGWFIDFALNFGAVANRLYGNPVFPRLSLEYRFL